MNVFSICRHFLSRPDVIITRDKRGFSSFDIRVMTPAELVQKAKE